MSFVVNTLKHQTRDVIRANGLDTTSIVGLSNVFEGPATKPFDGLSISISSTAQFDCKDHTWLAMVHAHDVLLDFSYIYMYVYMCSLNYAVLQHLCDTGTQTYCTERNINSKASW